MLVFETNPKITAYVLNGNAYMLSETIWTEDNQLKSAELSANASAQAFSIISPVLSQMEIKPGNQTIRMSAWVPEDFSYLVIIPPNLRETVFTKMFFLNGDGLSNFTKVFSNSKVRIYEVNA